MAACNKRNRRRRNTPLLENQHAAECPDVNVATSASVVIEPGIRNSSGEESDN
jgi:hypothetical protein